MKKITEIKDELTYKGLCDFMTPYGMIPEGRKYIGKQWKKMLVYDVATENIHKMFKLIK